MMAGARSIPPNDFAKLASSKMVRSALQNHPLHQPVETDTDFNALLSRLDSAEKSQEPPR